MSTFPDKSQSIAIIGLGIMGSAIARNLIAGGFSVQGYDTDTQVVQKNAERGVIVAATVLDAIQNCGIIFSSLPSETALKATVDALEEGSGGIKDGAVLVETSTLSLECKQNARDRLTLLGIETLDCPVSGTGAQAAKRDIVLYASGDEAAYTFCKTVFDVISRDSFFLGAFGNGMRMKFVANLLVAVHNVVTAEALSLAKQAGLDLQTVYEVISSGAGTSKIFELRGPMMVNDTYAPATMKLDVWQKDMALIEEFTDAVQAETPLFESTYPIYELAIKSGLGEMDTAAICRVFDQINKGN